MSEMPNIVANKGVFSVLQEAINQNKQMDEQGQEINDLKQEMNDFRLEIDDLKKEINDLKQENNDLKQENNDQKQKLTSLKGKIMRIRIAELVNERKERTLFKAARQRRNTIWYYPIVDLDLEAVEWLKINSLDGHQHAVQVFEAIYGLDLTTCSALVRTAPKEIIQALIQRSDLDSLHYYRCRSHGKGKIESMKQICTDIIRLWEDSTLCQGTVRTTYPSDQIMAKLSELERLRCEFWRRETRKPRWFAKWRWK